MGIFFKRTKIFNRAPVELSVFFDGQREPIPSGFYELPDQTIYMAKNQNPIMGTGEADNPHVSGTQYLICEEADPGFGVALSEAEWDEHLQRPSRVNEEAAFAEKYQNDPRAKLVVRGKGKKSTAASRYEANAVVRGTAEFTSRDA